jgi:uncharacterized Zn-finger protein
MVVESMDRIAIIRTFPTIEDAVSKMDGTAAGPTEIIEVDDRTLACDGGDGALGHPRVFLFIEKDSVLCPYCSRLYVLKPGAGHASGH